MTTAGAKGLYALVNGVNLYYEIYGEGEPLMLLHGGLGTVTMFSEVMLPTLAGARQVIAIEFQGNGHTADIDRPFSYEAFADDVAALITHLGHSQVDILGYSMGGGVAQQTAIRHPALVRKLVIISAPCKSEGWYPETRVGMSSMTAEMAKMWVGSPMEQAYSSIAPNPENWPMLAEKTSQMLKPDYDWSAQVAQLTTPILIMVGDSDGIRLTHAVEMYGLFGGGKSDSGMSPYPRARLAVLPATTHFSILVGPAATFANEFLDAPMPEVN